jgi:hypothetical protein
VIKKALEREPQARFADVAPLRRELLEDLADAGVDDARAELQKFFADPKGWAKEFRPRLVEKLTARGREQAAKGKTAAALEFWGRALSLEPKSPELRALVDGVARQRRLGRAAVLGAIVVVTAAIVGVGMRWMMLHPRPRPPVEKPIVTQPPKPVNEKPTNEKPTNVKPPVVVEHHAPIKQQRHVLVAPAPEPPPVAEVKREFTLVPIPRNASVLLDNKPIVFDAEHPTITVGPGEHHLEFSHKLCYGENYTIGAATESGRVRVHLGWKPAYLVITTDPPTADILYEDQAKKSGHKFQIKFLDPDVHERTVSLRVSAPGYESKTVEVKVGADQNVEESVTLKKQSGG